MTIKKRVQILAFEQKKSKSGNAYVVAECIVYGDQIRVGQMMVFGDMARKIAVGEFLATYEVTVNYERQVTAELVELLPYGQALDAHVKGQTAPTEKKAA